MPMQDTGIPTHDTAILGQYKHIMSIYTVKMDKHTACHNKDTELQDKHTPCLIMFTTLLNNIKTHSSILEANRPVLWVVEEHYALLPMYQMI
jgi:hypothetical protein